MAIDEYRRALEAAAKEYEALGAERQRIDKRLGELAQTISTLSRLCGLTSSVPWGLTDACRAVLRGAGVPMTPAEVRDRLRGIGFDLSTYANAMGAIHTTLRSSPASLSRFSVVPPGLAVAAQTGGQRATRRVARKVGYVWNRPPKAAMLGPDAAQVMRQMGEQRKARKRGGQ
jgi:hypothetical protein